MAQLVDNNQIKGAELWKPLPSFFTPGTSTWSDAGGELLTGPRRYDEAKKLLAEAGYKGEPVVLCVATDVQITKAQGDVTADLLGKIGMKVDYQALDWGTVGARRAKKDPPGAGGWNIFHTTWVNADMLNPVANVGTNARGKTGGWFGWPQDDQIETMRDAYARETDAAKQKQIAAAVQKRAYEVGLYYPTGMYTSPVASRSNVTGILSAAAPVFWNVEKK